ncbi:alpha/beta hydrolase [Mucilaginibacter gotjawali]|uniref:Carboxylesterase NlhH n=2 Tax=Mucilaginibacter gotjawali TaxID=1550579 RepID=A0A0X8X1A0_9SPHI|nr:alpha/beta hydrolase [Mucilaginibacter gotjawali]MBB3053703.1 acetyl esterase/lipase [Mucilaginibacter gotjawali]BAU53962.1 Carboxylesterase NlhH [Mucilaginibacter gotjawali]
MKKTFPLPVIFFLLISHFAGAQIAANKDIFPAGTTVLENIPYANDTLKKHTLDIYMPPVKSLGYPLIVWIHGGAWMSNDKHADMGYMTNTIKAFLNAGYVLASIDYRHSTTAPFPAQIQDCNRAIEYLYDNAAQYSIDESRIALIGFSAGGHLASLIGLSNNNTEKSFYYNGKKPQFKITVVLDFYGPSDFSTLKGHDSPDLKNPITLLLGGTVAEKPELAKKASPITYIDKKDPPFFIVQGEKDESVNPDQSILLSTRLKSAHVANQLTIVPGAPHYGVMFDTDFIKRDLMSFLNKYMK